MNHRQFSLFTVTDWYLHMISCFLNMRIVWFDQTRHLKTSPSLPDGHLFIVVFNFRVTAWIISQRFTQICCSFTNTERTGTTRESIRALQVGWKRTANPRPPSDKQIDEWQLLHLHISLIGMKKKGRQLTSSDRPEEEVVSNLKKAIFYSGNC